MIQPKLILPNRRVSIPKGIRVYFLLGPIRGGGDWQKRAIDYLTEKDPECYIVCPSRYIHKKHPYATYALPDEENLPEYPSQTLWERHYLEIAACQGSIVAWLPLQNPKDPRDPKDGPYGQDTYGELGEWRMRSKYGIGIDGKLGYHINIAIGGEEGYHGLPVIGKNYKAMLGANHTIHTTLESTLDAAIKKAIVQTTPTVADVKKLASGLSVLELYETGETIRANIENQLREGSHIIFDFKGIKKMAWQASHGLFGNLLQSFSIETITRNITIRNASKDIVDTIRYSFARYLVEKHLCDGSSLLHIEQIEQNA